MARSNRLTSSEAPLLDAVVDIYLNLHRPGHLSVRAVEGPRARLVIGHVEAIELADCVFRVSAAGRERVRRERCKNVHATIRGRVVRVLAAAEGRALATAIEAQRGAVVYYSPYKTEHFITTHNADPIFAAARVVAVGKFVVADGFPTR